MENYTKNLSEPWFSLIKLKKKRVEGRLNKGDFNKIKIGDIIKFTNNDFGFNREFNVKITKIYDYDTFRDYLENEKLEKCLPGIESIEEGIKVYHNFYSVNDENKYKIKAFSIKIV